MLKDIKATNEKLLAEHFQQLFGEGYTVAVNWGFPFVVIHLVLDTQETRTETKISVDIMQDGTFQLQVLGAKKVYAELPEDAPKDALPLMTLVPDWSTIDSNTIGFVTTRVKEITEQFFTTRVMPEPVTVEEVVEEEKVEEPTKEVDAGEWKEEKTEPKE